MVIPKGKYLGKLCKRGHEWGNSGKSLRYQRTGYNGPCVLCHRGINLALYHSGDKDKVNDRRRKLREEKGERVRALARASYHRRRKKILSKIALYRSNNLELTRAKWRKWYELNKDERRKKQNIAARDASLNLIDSYVKHSLRMKGDVPIGLIVAKRETLKLKRLIRKLGG